MDWNKGASSQNEIMLIGSVCIDPAEFENVVVYARSDDFENTVCRDAFSAAEALHSSGADWNVMSLVDELCKRGHGEQSSVDFLRDCMAAAATSQNAEIYAKLVRQQSQRRSLQQIADNISDSVFYHEDSGAIAAEAFRAIEEIYTDDDRAIVDSATAIQNWYKWAETAKHNIESVLVQTGFEQLDKQLGGGLFNSGMYVIGARPGMGKTTVGINLADRIASRGKKVLFVSLEMPSVQITAKRIAIRSGISYTALMTGRFDDEAYRVINMANTDLAGNQFFIADKGKQTVSDILSLAVRLKGVDVIFVDYLGLISPTAEDVSKTKYEQASNISASLKAMAKTLNIPIVVLCQLNRESTKTASKKPNLTDLRDSGAIEQDADGVILLHRDSYYCEDKPDLEDIELIIAKNRHSAPGKVTMTWKAASGAIYEQTGREYE